MKMISAALVLALSIGNASADSIIVGWGDADGFGENLTNPCNPPDQVHELVGAFLMPAGLSAVYSMEATVDFCTLPVNLPPWWGGNGAQLCTPAGLSANADFTSGPFTAVDYFRGKATTSMTFETGVQGNPVRARAVITVDIDPSEAIPAIAGTKYYAFKFVIDGRGATCSGCSYPACFMVNGITLRGPEGKLRFYGPYYSSFGGWLYFGLGCPFIVPVVEQSFGAVKALFD